MKKPAEAVGEADHNVRGDKGNPQNNNKINKRIEYCRVAVLCLFLEKDCTNST